LLTGSYIQVFVNVSIVLFVLYLAVQFVLTVKRDVKDRMQEVSVGGYRARNVANV
jgi:hypothetical protein